jgi:hypothetical protein
LKHKIRRKSVKIALNSLIKIECFNAMLAIIPKRIYLNTRRN